MIEEIKYEEPQGDEHNVEHPEDHRNEQSGTHALVRPENKTKTPSFYKVILLNDDFTPREYVVLVLQKFFKKTAKGFNSDYWPVLDGILFNIAYHGGIKLIFL